MTTVQNIIDRALEHLNVTEAGQTTSAEDADLGLRALSSLLDLWQLDPQVAIGSQEFVYTPSGGQETVTIGPTGQIVATMPARIDASSFVRRGGVDYPLAIADTLEQYNAVAFKGLSGPLMFIYYDRGNLGTGTVYLSPAADGTSELHLFARQDLIDGYSSLTLTTVLTLPNGYRNALEWNLAAELAEDFPGEAKGVEVRAMNALRKLKRANFKSRQLSSGVPLKPNSGQIVFSTSGDEDSTADGGTP